MGFNFSVSKFIENNLEQKFYDDLFEMELELTKTLTSSDHIFENIVIQDLKFEREDHRDFCSNGFFFAFETLQNKRYSETSMVTFFGAGKPSNP